MTSVVSLRGVVDEMDGLADDFTAYINGKTGKLITLSEEDHRALDEDENFEDLLDWEREMLPKVLEVLNSDDFIALPDKFQIHEWSIMERFYRTIPNPEQRGQLMDAILGKGAFRYFKDTIHRLGIADDWYQFRRETLEEIASDFLEAHEIPFKR